MEKKVPERKDNGTRKKLETELCTSHVNDRNPIIAPNEENIKITRPFDLKIAEVFLEEAQSFKFSKK